MRFTVLIPARLQSSRLPRKVLADLAGVPMVVRVAQQAALCSAYQVVVAADHADIVAACENHGVKCLLTRPDHATGSDRLAQACDLLGLADTDIIVNVQGDEPLINPQLINACAQLLNAQTECVMSTAAHAIESVAEWLNPNVVKVVCDGAWHALYFSRAPIPARQSGAVNALPTPAPLRHVGIYGYRAAFLRRFPSLPPCPLEATESLEQLRVLWHGERIAVHVSHERPSMGVDTQEDLQRVREFLA
jgi:3-deoxy-manno-octulosonate cytidylyltransferase (CMP-KDO synthetase)